MTLLQYEQYQLANLQKTQTSDQQQLAQLKNKITILQSDADVLSRVTNPSGGTGSDPFTFRVPGSRSSSLSGGGTAIVDLGSLFGLGLPSQQHLTAAIGLYDNETWFSLGSVGSGHAPALNSAIAVSYLVSGN